MTFRPEIYSPSGTLDKKEIRGGRNRGGEIRGGKDLVSDSNEKAVI